VRFLGDMGVSPATIRALNEFQHDAVHVRQLGMARASDASILAKAREDGRIVLTFDLDFGEIMAAGGANGPSVIIFRLHDQSSASVTPRLMKVLAACENKLLAGAIIVVEDQRFRVRQLPINRLR
jgi:predicted nuclease of predicted toxin-antitoxin system